MIYEYNGKVHRVVDGDTIVIDVDLGFESYRRVTFRIYNLDTFETRLLKGTSEEDKKRGIAIKEFVADILFNKEVKIQTFMKKGFYKRYLCSLKFDYQDQSFNDHPIYFRELMIDLGCDKNAGALPLENLLEGTAYPKEIIMKYENAKRKYGILE